MALNKPTGDMLNAGSDSAAQDLGTAAAGMSSSYSRADHVHKLPSAADVGAVATSQLGALSGVATLDAGGKLTTAQIPALTTAQIAQITPAGIGAMATSERAGLATLTAGSLTTTQALALTGDVTSTAGNPATTVGKIQGKAISNATPTTGQTLVWDGAQWAPAATLSPVNGTGLLKNTSGALQSPASLLFDADVDASAAIANSKIAGLAASATSDTTNASNIISGTLRTDQLATISGLPAGAQGSGTLVPVVTVDSKGRVTALTTTAITGGAGTVTTSGTGLTGNLSKFSSETEITKAVAGTDYQAALTTAQPLALTRGGTGAAIAQAAISNLGIGMRMVEAQTIASVAGAMVGNVFTVTATGVFSGADNYTIALGDIIAFTTQATTTQNGFWEVTTLGAVGVQTVFTRPSWYAGVVKNTMYMPRFGSAQGGYVMAAIGPLGTSEITVGTTLITAVQVNYREKPALITSNTFTGPQVFRSNQTAANRNPFSFSLGSGLMTTPQAHAVEWFADTLYITTAAAVRKAVAFTDSNITGTAANVSGTVAVANGGTGQTIYTNGQLLIGNTTGSTLAKATLTPGTGIAITNGAGAITVGLANTTTVSTAAPSGGVDGDFWYQY